MIAKESQRENKTEAVDLHAKKGYSPFQGSSPPLSVMEGKYQQVKYYISLPDLSSKDSFIKCSVKRLSAGRSKYISR